jgi:hypothetical protein
MQENRTTEGESKRVQPYIPIKIAHLCKHSEERYEIVLVGASWNAKGSFGYAQ